MPSIFSLSRRKRRPTVTETQSTASLPLPNLDPSEPGLGSWPESLVDVNSLAASTNEHGQLSSAAARAGGLGAGGGTGQQTTPTKAGATRSAFAVQGGTISFHRPFRGPPPSAFHPSAGSGSGGGMNGSQSVPLNLSLDPSHNKTLDPNLPSVPSTPTHKRPRAPVQTFNILVAGARGSGKTSLLNLLLATSTLPPPSSKPAYPTISFPLTPTQEIKEQKTEVVQGLRTYMLALTDSPGLELGEGKELEFDRGVQALVRWQEERMADALVRESRVVREMVADRLVHLCIYLIDPTSISPSPNGKMHPKDILAIQRLSKRYHVLPIISKADTLTDRQLRRVKDVVRREVGRLGEGGNGGWGVFAFPPGAEVEKGEEKGWEKGEGEGGGKENGNGHTPTADVDTPSDSDTPASPTSPNSPDTPSTPTPRAKRIIHIRPTRPHSLAPHVHAPQAQPPKSPSLRRARSLSRARPSAESSDSDTPTMSTPEAVKRELGGLLPWAVVAPEEDDSPFSSSSSSSDPNSLGAKQAADSTQDEAEHADAEGRANEPRLVRTYRWGTIDVLNKEHCDFWALRKAVLGVYFKLLKTDTRRVLYERYRTERLLVRRATRAMSEEERKKIYGI